MWQFALAAVVAWIACTWLVRRSRIAALAAAFALPLIALSLLWPEPPIVTPNALEITALDVGQGDSILAINPEGATMLIDAGGPVGSHGVSEITSSFDVGEQVVAPYLWSRRLRLIDILVLTHAHTDHMGGMPAILEDLHPRELWVGIDPNSRLYRALLAEAARLNIPVRHLHAGDHQPWGSVEIAVLGPAVGYSNPNAPKNDDSVVLHMQFGQASVLLEGDAERPSEDTMLSAGLITPVTLLKVGHHGSKTSSNPEFLAAARPQEAVISVGRHNTFGHPRAEVIQRFAEAHTRLFRTDEFGLTTFLLTADGHIQALVDETPVN
jgi:competence protein ComEC